jgi:hypothetical protein
MDWFIAVTYDNGHPGIGVPAFWRYKKSDFDGRANLTVFFAIVEAHAECNPCAFRLSEKRVGVDRFDHPGAAGGVGMDPELDVPVPGPTEEDLEGSGFTPETFPKLDDPELFELEWEKWWEKNRQWRDD